MNRFENDSPLTERIVGGNESLPGEFPWQVSVAIFKLTATRSFATFHLQLSRNHRLNTASFVVRLTLTASTLTLLTQNVDSDSFDRFRHLSIFFVLQQVFSRSPTLCHSIDANSFFLSLGSGFDSIDASTGRETWSLVWGCANPSPMGSYCFSLHYQVSV
jgi:hypothetical protein